jgi:hypothetical protein
MDQRSRTIATWITYFVVLASTLAVLFSLLYKTSFTLTGALNLDQLEIFITLALIFVLSLALGFGLRSVLFPLVQSGTATPFSQQALEQSVRDRLARNVVATGTIVIAVLAVALIIAIAKFSSANLPTTGLSVFTAVLPVFATWVGTVLAFYFTNESFRQAAQSTLSLIGRDEISTQAITRAGTMIPYDKITKFEITAASMPAGTTAVAAADATPLNQITARFNQTATRIIIFDPNRHPIYVVRQKNIPPGLPGNSTVIDYINSGTNRADALNFRHVSADGGSSRCPRLVNM